MRRRLGQSDQEKNRPCEETGHLISFRSVSISRHAGGAVGHVTCGGEL